MLKFHKVTDLVSWMPRSKSQGSEEIRSLIRSAPINLRSTLGYDFLEVGPIKPTTSERQFISVWQRMALLRYQHFWTGYSGYLGAYCCFTAILPNIVKPVKNLFSESWSEAAGSPPIVYKQIETDMSIRSVHDGDTTNSADNGENLSFHLCQFYGVKKVTYDDAIIRNICEK